MLDLLKRCFLLFGIGQPFRSLQFVIQKTDSLVHPLDFASVAAQQIVAQIHTVLHHLKLHRIGGIGKFQGSSSGRFRGVLAVYCH